MGLGCRRLEGWQLDGGSLDCRRLGFRELWRRRLGDRLRRRGLWRGGWWCHRRCLDFRKLRSQRPGLFRRTTDTFAQAQIEVVQFVYL